MSFLEGILVLFIQGTFSQDFHVMKTVLSDQFKASNVFYGGTVQSCLSLACQTFGTCDIITFDPDLMLCKTGDLDLELKSGNPIEVWIVTGKHTTRNVVKKQGASKYSKIMITRCQMTPTLEASPTRLPRTLAPSPRP